MFRNLMLVLFVVLALVIGAGVVVAQGDPEPCRNRGWKLTADVSQQAFEQIAPCRWLIVFADTSEWKLKAGAVPVVATDVYLRPTCRITKRGVIKARPSCAINVKAEPETPEGTSFTFSLIQR